MVSYNSNDNPTGIIKFIKQGIHNTSFDPANTITFVNKNQIRIAINSSYSNSKSKPVVLVAQVSSQKFLPISSQISRGTNSASLIIEHALSLLGTPYIFGGTTRNGIDCSGFTRYVFAGSGIYLPRTSYEQYNMGEAVSRNDLQPGDLVFFTTYAKGASHVGIYIGGGRFVQASNPASGVKISNLSENYYCSRYLGARRVL
jgi:Cell wall-associated hydrolases (invasion-associated proteins)